MDKVTIYTTIENQIRPDGSTGLLFDHYTTYEAALAKIYTVLAAAAVSGIPYHSACIYRSDGIVTDGRVFDRRTDEGEGILKQGTPFYTTLENQIRNDGSYGLLYDHFTDVDQADHKLYTILAAAAVSDIPYHSGHIMSNDGLLTGGKVYDRRTTPTVEFEAEV